MSRRAPKLVARCRVCGARLRARADASPAQRRAIYRRHLALHRDELGPRARSLALSAMVAPGAETVEGTDA